MLNIDFPFDRELIQSELDKSKKVRRRQVHCSVSLKKIDEIDEYAEFLNSSRSELLSVTVNIGLNVVRDIIASELQLSKKEIKLKDYTRRPLPKLSEVTRLAYSENSNYNLDKEDCPDIH